MAAKYIVVHSGFGTESIIVFSELLSHADVARGQSVVSAGMIQLGDRDAACYGRSSTLDLNARPEEDSWLANKQLYPS